MDELRYGINLIEKEDLLKKWNISDKKLKELVIYNTIRVVYDVNRKPITGYFNDIRRKFFDPFSREYTHLPPGAEREHVKDLFESLYKDIRFFDLKEILRKDTTYTEYDLEAQHSLSNHKDNKPIVRREVAMAVAKPFNKKMPNPEVVKGVNNYLTENGLQPYHPKHLQRIIKKMAFQHGKPGPKSKK